MSMPNAYAPQQGSPYGGPPATDKRMERLGLVALILAAIELAYSTQKVVGSIASGPMLELQRKLVVPPRAGTGAPPMNDIMDAATEMTKRIAAWDIVRSIPFLVASGLLVWISLRIYKGRTSALAHARTWSLGALGVVALSALIQALVTVPATIEYARRIAESMPKPRGGASAPFDAQAFMQTFTAAVTIASLAIGTIFLAAWPIVLRIWAGKLERDLAPTPDSQGYGGPPP